MMFFTKYINARFLMKVFIYTRKRFNAEYKKIKLLCGNIVNIINIKYGNGTS